MVAHTTRHHFAKSKGACFGVVWVCFGVGVLYSRAGGLLKDFFVLFLNRVETAEKRRGIGRRAASVALDPSP